ncbi:protein-L-isoaspartate(D-aspartate) O-methyltransferase [Cyclobacterium marinum]|uniref:Protein-L-isoaspartate O-methyltransferase n=1 Tax=Cyclobacterium marinum (strain ATCC 25205 / DSM 745 / LMG 13164 / NCIMB 1802) TaxID=880070 RepID=G0IZD5_CYCMS|nr:protein-L-isoaspartate(D-aspartate) O-methyltransferase [Cyclobacterium marinum]AEL24408.1 Protein-L-isoaspartate O-methyltransferase [Cyclobacterium marinum DSM 745]MBI0399065.1 protein-L-isoaspartate(D-aspartate) O-methyltransferase [Cyclobacterium marinum]MBR9773495.1 protein-L-isoaspartate(D-aspartate) O-methyltransferase [Cytophagales bacterium]|tara:strand:- start:34741 stop:35397 length:657 start_codon:yes stop_codon:yes gene_type:complete
MFKLEDSYLHKGKRRELIRTLRNKGIRNEAILEAFNNVPRHFFFDSALLSHAYEDKAFPIGEGQTISQPYTVAFQTELLSINPGDKVLEIGTGSGYQAGILYCLGANVHSIEYNKVLYERTKKFLPKIGVKIKHYHGDGSLGLPNQAPFDKIIVTAGAPVVPKTLLLQLKIGGILVIPVGDRKKQQMLKLTKQTNKQILKESFDNFSFVPLRGDEGWE